jgi:hypothetical protein
MKAIKILIASLSLYVISQSSHAQNCKGNTVLMSKGARGCSCQCQKKCVPAADVQTYLADGWSYGDCYYTCCFGHGGFFKTEMTGIYAVPASNEQVIRFSLSQKQHVSFKVYDWTGNLVTTIADKTLEEGENKITWNVPDIKTGIYVVRMETEGWSETKKLSVVK